MVVVENSGIVDQHIDRMSVITQLSHQMVDLIGLAEITAITVDGAVQRHGFIQRRLPSPTYDHRIVTLGQRYRQALANTAAAAGYQYGVAAQLHARSPNGLLVLKQSQPVVVLNFSS